MVTVSQPTDDIVLMAQSLEKAFLQKVAQMPQEEIELPPPPPRGKPGKPGRGRRATGEHQWGGCVTVCVWLMNVFESDYFCVWLFWGNVFDIDSFCQIM